MTKEIAQTKSSLVIVGVHLHAEKALGKLREFFVFLYAEERSVPTTVETDMTKVVRLKKIYSLAQLDELFSKTPPAFSWLKRHYKLDYEDIRLQFIVEGLPENSDTPAGQLVGQALQEFLEPIIANKWRRPNPQEAN